MPPASIPTSTSTSTSTASNQPSYPPSTLKNSSRNHHLFNQTQGNGSGSGSGISSSSSDDLTWGQSSNNAQGGAAVQATGAGAGAGTGTGTTGGLSRQNSATRLTAVNMLRRAASQREMRNLSPNLVNVNPSDDSNSKLNPNQPQSQSNPSQATGTDSSLPLSSLDIPIQNPLVSNLNRAGSAAGDYGRAGVGLAKARERARIQALELEKSRMNGIKGLVIEGERNDGDQDQDDDEDDDDNQDENSQEEFSSSSPLSRGKESGDPTLFSRDDSSKSPSTSPLSFLKRPENPIAKSPSISSHPSHSPTSSRNPTPQPSSNHLKPPTSQFHSRSPLPSLDQLRARILHERSNQGLARSASTGSENAASQASRAARLYAMEKLLGAEIGDEDSKFLSTERKRMSKRISKRISKRVSVRNSAMVEKEKEKEKEKPKQVLSHNVGQDEDQDQFEDDDDDGDAYDDDEYESDLSSSSEASERRGRRKEGGFLRPGSMISALNKGRAPSPEPEPRAWEITESYQKRKSSLNQSLHSSSSSSSTSSDRKNLDRNGKSKQGSTASSSSNSRISSLSERERRRTLRRSRTIGSLNERFDDLKKDDLSNFRGMSSNSFGSNRGSSTSSSIGSVSIRNLSGTSNRILQNKDPIYEDPKEDESQKESGVGGDFPSSAKGKGRDRNGMIRVGRAGGVAAESWKLENGENHENRELEPISKGSFPTSNQNLISTATMAGSNLSALPGWQNSPISSPRNLTSELPPILNEKTSNPQSHSNAVTQSNHVEESGLKRQLSKREIVRNEMMRKLSGRGRGGTNLGVGGKSNHDSPTLNRSDPPDLNQIPQDRIDKTSIQGAPSGSKSAENPPSDPSPSFQKQPSQQQNLNLPVSTSNSQTSTPNSPSFNLSLPDSNPASSNMNRLSSNYNPSIRAISNYSNSNTETDSGDRDHFQYQSFASNNNNDENSGNVTPSKREEFENGNASEVVGNEVEEKGKREQEKRIDDPKVGNDQDEAAGEEEELNLGRGITSWISKDDVTKEFAHPHPHEDNTKAQSIPSSTHLLSTPESKTRSILETSPNDSTYDTDRGRESMISGQSIPLGLGKGNVRSSNYSIQDDLPTSDSLMETPVGFHRFSHSRRTEDEEEETRDSSVEVEGEVDREDIETIQNHQDTTLTEKYLVTNRVAEDGTKDSESIQSINQTGKNLDRIPKPTLSPLALDRLSPVNLNVPQSLSPSIGLSPSESVSSFSTSASPSKSRRRRSKAKSLKSLRKDTGDGGSIKNLKVFDGSDNETETENGSQWDGEDEIDLDAYMRDSESEEEEESDEEEEGSSSEVIDGRDEKNMGLGINNGEGGEEKVKEVEVQSLKPQLGPIKISTRPIGAGHHHRSSSVLEDLGEKPSERLQAILGASFVQQYGDAAYFDQPSPMEVGKEEEKRLGWKQNESEPSKQPEKNSNEKERQLSMDSLTENEVLPIQIQDTRKVLGAQEIPQRTTSKPPVPTAPIPERLKAAVDSPSSLEAPATSATASSADSKTPIAGSQFAQWQSQGPVPQFDSTRQIGLQQYSIQPLSSARAIDPEVPQQQSSPSPSPVISQGRDYHPPPASSAQLASFYADDKLKPFPGFVTPGVHGPTPMSQAAPLDQHGHSRSDSRSGQTASPVAGSRAFAAPSPVNSPAPADLSSGSNSNSLSRAHSNKTSNFFSSLRRKASGAQTSGGGGASSPSSRLFGSAIHKRSGSALGLSSNSKSNVVREDSPVQIISKQSPLGASSVALPSQVQADRSKVHSRSMSASSAASSRHPDQSFNSIDTSNNARLGGSSTPVHGFDSERLANGKAEHLRSEEDSRDNLEVQYALEPSTAAKLQRYSQMLTSPISPGDYPSSSPLRTENEIPDLPTGAAEEHVPGISSHSLSDPPRKLVKAGPIYQVVSDTMVKDRFLLLFDDLLVIAKPVAPPLPSSSKEIGSSTPNPVLANLEWTFSAKSIVELHHVKLSTPKETVSQPKEHPLMASFVSQFQNDPTGALERIIAQSSLPRDASTVAQLLFHTPGLDRGHLTAYITAPERKNVLQAYVSLFRLSSVSIESALRSFLLELRFPTRVQEFEALLLTFAKRWTEANAGLIKPAFTSQLGADLVYAIMALNDAVHSGKVASSPSRKAPGLFSEPVLEVNRSTFLESFRAHDPEMVLSDRTLSRIYSSVVSDTLAQSLFPEESHKRIGICVVGALPSKLTFGVTSEPIKLRIPSKDKDFAIRLYGQDLVFDPPILTFDSTNERSFTITSKSIGTKHAVFVRAGRNAQFYTAGPPGEHQREGEIPLPRSSAVSVERAFVRNSFTLSIVGGSDTAGVAKKRYMFSVADDEARSEWVRVLKLTVKKSLANRKTLSSSRKAADAIARDVLREALIEAEDLNAAIDPSNPYSNPNLQRSVSASAATQTSQKSLLPPSTFNPNSTSSGLARNVSHSHHYYNATGKMEKELLAPMSEVDENENSNTSNSNPSSTLPLRRANTQLKDSSSNSQRRLEPLSTISSHSSNSRSLSPASALNHTLSSTTETQEDRKESNLVVKNKDLTGEALITTCRQNSLLPLVLDQLRSTE